MSHDTLIRPPLPPFTHASAVQKVRLAEDGWNSRDPKKVSLAYSHDTQWRNRAEFINNREQARAFLDRKWKKSWIIGLSRNCGPSPIPVRYAYEWHDDSGNWFRSYGNENWEFGADGLMTRRFACINDLPIKEHERKYHWPLGRRPDDHPGLTELGFERRPFSCDFFLSPAGARLIRAGNAALPMMHPGAVGASRRVRPA